VNFNKLSYEVREDSDEVMIMIMLNRPSFKPFDVIINSVDVTTRGKQKCIHSHDIIIYGTEGDDYLRSFGVVKVPANEISKQLAVYMINDKMAEYNETFTLTLSVPSSSCGVISGSINTSEVMIRDDDGEK